MEVITNESLAGTATARRTPNLARTLGLWSIVGLGLGYMTPTVIFDTFGNVAGIEPSQRDGRTVYRVGLNLRQAQRIPTDSQALIASPGLLSAPLIDIREGRSLETRPAGGEIPAGNTANLMDSVSALADDFARLSATSVCPPT